MGHLQLQVPQRAQPVPALRHELQVVALHRRFCTRAHWNALVAAFDGAQVADCDHLLLLLLLLLLLVVVVVVL